MSGTLFLVAMPIGNYDDITLRAQRVLHEVDAVVCEEPRVGSAVLARYQIDKPLSEVNEHTTVQEQNLLIERLVHGESLALISDHGTPLVQDPGGSLVRQAIRAGIRVEPIPGASAVLAALVASGLPAPRFRFLGQLPPKTDARRRAVRGLREVRETFILLDAPYRLLPLLRTLRDELGEERRSVVACNLTQSDENFVRGMLAQVVAHFEDKAFKGEFVVIVEGHQTSTH